MKTRGIEMQKLTLAFILYAWVWRAYNTLINTMSFCFILAYIYMHFHEIGLVYIICNTIYTIYISQYCQFLLYVWQNKALLSTTDSTKTETKLLISVETYLNLVNNNSF